MTPHKQLFRHKPEDGVWGDCHRTAVACLLNLKPEDVPHVFDKGRSVEEGNAIMDEFLRKRGMRMGSVAYHGTDSLSTVLTTIDANMPGLIFILGGTSKNGTGHSVVAGRRRILHDPSLDDSGIVGPMEDGHWWINFLLVATDDMDDVLLAEAA